MKAASAGLITHIAQPVTTLAYLCKITRLDGVVVGFTTHDQTLTVSGVNYKPQAGMVLSKLEATAGLSSDPFGLSGAIDSADITDADLRNGKYDNARVDVYACNWADLTQGVIQLKRGFMGEVKITNSGFEVEMRGLHDLMQRERGFFYTAECRHDLGNSACGVNLASYTVTGTVTAATSRAVFTHTARTEATGYFNYGKITFTSGLNNGLSMEVKAWDLSTKTFTLWLPMPFDIQAGDGYSVYAGCDKRGATCKSKFSNFVNFGGFPHMAKAGDITDYPDAR